MVLKEQGIYKCYFSLRRLFCRQFVSGSETNRHIWRGLAPSGKSQISRKWWKPRAGGKI